MDDVVTLVIVGALSGAVSAIAAGLYCWRAGRIFERWKISRNLADIITRAVDAAIGPGGENWAEPMRKEIHKRFFEQIEATGKTTRH